MAQTGAQDFDSMLQEFLVDMNGDGVPDARVSRPAPADQRVQVAQLGGGGPSIIPGLAKMLGLAGAGYVGYRAVQGDGDQPAAPAPPPEMETTQANEPPSQGMFVNRLMQPRPGDAPVQSASRGGVLDMLNLPPDSPAPAPRNALMETLNQAVGVADFYGMGIPSTIAGLVNAAIPGQPLGGLAEARDASSRAQRSAAGTSLGRDLMALPQAFAGMGPYSMSTGGIPAIGGRGPARALSEEAAGRFSDDLAAGNRRYQDVTRPPPLALEYQPSQPLDTMFQRQFDRQRSGIVRREVNPERRVLEQAQQRADMQARQALRRDAQQPAMTRDAQTQAIDAELTRLTPGAGGPRDARGNMLGLIEDVAAATGTEPWQVIRAMTARGYDLSGLTRAAFQAPRQGGRFGAMDDEARALWDMVRYDQDVLYRQRGAPYEAQPRNALMPPSDGAPPLPRRPN